MEECSYRPRNTNRCATLMLTFPAKKQEKRINGVFLHFTKHLLSGKNNEELYTVLVSEKKYTNLDRYFVYPDNNSKGVCGPLTPE